MSKPIPTNIKICHIVHIDKLASIIKDEHLWSDVEAQRRRSTGTFIGMENIKDRRLNNFLTSYPDLHVGECVPFYFCPRSVMLYLFHMNNHPDITYHGGQQPILHLVANLEQVVSWATQNNKRWVFTDSNAGSYYFNDYNNLNKLNRIDWKAVNARDWKNYRERKQAEFLIEKKFPWELIESIGVFSAMQLDQANQILDSAGHRPSIQVNPHWYY